MLETLLIRLKCLMPDKETLQEFINSKNNDQLSPIDYCVFKHRYDIKVVLEEFVVTSQ